MMMKHRKASSLNIKTDARYRVKRNQSESSGRAKHLPATYPVDDSGREILLSVKHVDITFGKGAHAVHAVKDASFDIYRGETFSLVGESGSGKTTLGRAIIRANPCAAGEIDYRGVRITGKIKRSLDRDFTRNVQMVFQDTATGLNERATVDYIISEGLYNFHLYESEAERAAKAKHILTEVGLLPEHLSRYPHEFSGGQRQRIGLARAMIMEPELVVADEPISALDVSIRAQVLNLMNVYKTTHNATYLFIAHDLSIVRLVSDRIGVIYKGVIVEIAAANELFDYPLHPYTRSLISAIPIPDPRLEKSKVVYYYDSDMHDYTRELPALCLIGHEHYVYGTAREIEECKRIRRNNVPLKCSDYPKMDAFYHAIDKRERHLAAEHNTASNEFHSDKPVHDTGSGLYALAAFLLPLMGVVAAVLFKKHNYIRNSKQCMRGALACLITIGTLLSLFGILLLLTLRHI